MSNLPTFPRDGGLPSAEAFELELGAAEVEEQAHLDAGRVEIVDDLRLVLGGQRLDGLQFHDDAALDEQVGIEVADAVTPEDDLDRMLRDSRQALLS